MTYTTPTVRPLDTTPEAAGCQPCIRIDALGLEVRSPQVKVGDQTVGVGSPCPQTPVPGTPEVGGFDGIKPIGGDGDAVLPSSFSADAAGVSVGADF